jgi:hypothetical protein
MNKDAYAARQRATYFQFPLCAFAFGRTERERLDTIIHFSLVEAGQKHWGKLSEDARRVFIEKQKDLPSDFDGMQESHCIAICGANVTGVRIGSIRFCLCQHAKLKRFTNAYQQRYGPDTLVRLRTDLVFEARNGKGINPCELSLLAAIFSIIGRKQGPVRIIQERIICRALGYKSKVVMSAELPKRKDGSKPLTDWKTRSCVLRLQRRRFFARATYGRRLTFYSHRMTEKQLRREVFEMKTFAFANQRLAQLDDQAMSDAIRNQRAALSGQSPPVPHAKPLAQTGEIPSEDVF